MAPARLSPRLSQLLPFTDRHRRIKGILGREAPGISPSLPSSHIPRRAGSQLPLSVWPWVSGNSLEIKEEKGKKKKKPSSPALCLGSIASDTVEYSSLANMFSGFVEKALKKKSVSWRSLAIVTESEHSQAWQRPRDKPCSA